jgi:hypothetical protein
VTPPVVQALFTNKGIALRTAKHHQSPTARLRIYYSHAVPPSTPLTRVPRLYNPRLHLYNIFKVDKMKVSVAASLLLGTTTAAYAFPYHKQRPDPVALKDPTLQKPMHTTDLMAGKAYILSRSATQTHTQTQYPPSAPTKSTAPFDQYEL